MSISQRIIEKVSSLPEDLQRQVLDFTEFLRYRHRVSRRALDLSAYVDHDEHRAIGEAGAKLVTEVLDAEDFSDWPGYRKGSEKQNG